MTAVRRLLLLSCVVLSASGAFAQTTAKKSKPALNPSQGTPTTVTTDPAAADAKSMPTEDTVKTQPVTADTDQDLNDPRAMHLSLDQAVQMTVQNNLTIQLSRFDDRISGQQLLGSYAIFDPLLTADLERQKQTSPTISQFITSSSSTNIFDVGIAQALPTGGNYSLSLSNQRAEQTGGGTFVNPSYSSGLNFSANQPLLRDFGIDVTRRNITIARNNLGLSAEAFRAVLISTAEAVEQAYLDLVYARDNVDVQKETLFLARDQARITQIRINVGASAPLDILQPRVQIATSEESLISAVADVRNAEDRLRTLLHLPPGDWDRPILPSDAVDYKPMPIDVSAAVSRAYDLRPEMREENFVIANKQVQLLYARNQLLPALNLKLNYGAAGLGGTFYNTDPVTGATVVTASNSYPHAYEQIFRNDYPSWTIGLNVAVPIFNIGARAQAKTAELDLQRQRTDKEQTRQNIATDVRTTARAIDTAAKQISATRAAREAAEQNLDAERKRYENGMVTNFEVLQIQQQLADARVREIQALVGYNKNVADYHRAVGDLLDVRNIRVEDPDHVEEPHFFSRLDRYNWLNFGNYIDQKQEPANVGQQQP